MCYHDKNTNEVHRLGASKILTDLDDTAYHDSVVLIILRWLFALRKLRSARLIVATHLVLLLRTDLDVVHECRERVLGSIGSDKPASHAALCLKFKRSTVLF